MNTVGRSICGAALGSMLLALTSVAHAEPVQKIKIQDYPGVGNLHARVAIELGYCAKNKLDCELSVIPSSPLGLQALAAGSIDVSMASIEPTIQAVMSGARLEVIGTNWADNIFFLILSNSLTTPNLSKGYPDVMKDLKGKKIGVTARGSAAEFQFKDLLINAGMKPDDVTYVAVGSPNTAYPAVVNQQLDAAVTFEPAGAMCQVLNTCRVAISFARGEGSVSLKDLNGAATVFVVRTDTSGPQQEKIKAFSAAMREADGFIHQTANRKRVEEISNKYFKLGIPESEKIVSVALDRYIESYRFTIDPASVQKAADYLFKTGQIPTKFDTSKLVVPR